MKSKSSTFLFSVITILGIGGVVYYVSQHTSAQSPQTGLVSSAGTSGIPTAASTSSSATGQQVVNLLRSLSTIQLSDAVFQNPTFSLLQDMSIALPPVTNPGRRNPFAPIGNDGAPLTGITPDLQSTDATPAGLVEETIPVSSKTPISKTVQ